MSSYSEDVAVEQPAIDLLGTLGWLHIDCFHERFGRGSTLGREQDARLKPCATTTKPSGLFGGWWRSIPRGRDSPSGFVLIAHGFSLATGCVYRLARRALSW